MIKKIPAKINKKIIRGLFFLYFLEFLLKMQPLLLVFVLNKRKNIF